MALRLGTMWTIVLTVQGYSAMPRAGCWNPRFIPRAVPSSTNFQRNARFQLSLRGGTSSLHSPAEQNEDKALEIAIQAGMQKLHANTPLTLIQFVATQSPMLRRRLGSLPTLLAMECKKAP
mmetsp:Transcript_58066/g.152634  ORF Transcript_58066/g.152634 Transcript_58066/m.152634 type:complete len:121 (-) Transcript_58066:210-572(-)